MAILQNMWVQIAIGLLPAAVVAIVMLFKKKLYRMAYITLTVGLTAALLCSCVVGVTQASASTGTTRKKKTETAVSAAQMTELANSFLLAGDAEGAREMVETYADTYGYDATCTLINARICVLEQRYEAALGSYRKHFGENLPEEAVATQLVVQGLHADLVLADRLEAAGKPLNLNFTEDEFHNLVNGGVMDLVKQAMAKDEPSREIREGVDWIRSANDLYDRYLSQGYADSTEVEELAEAAEDFEKDAVFRRLDTFRQTRVKIMLLAGDHKQIVSYFNENAGDGEYMTVLELYMAGFVERNDLSKVLDAKKIRGIEKLEPRLRRLLVRNEDSLTYEEQCKLEEQLAMVRSYAQDAVLYRLEAHLRTAALDPDNYKQASKFYMALSKLYDHRGDTELRNQYFSEALVTANASDDGDYAQAMEGLSSVVSGDANDAAIKEVKNNAAKAVANSHHIKGAGNLIQNSELQENLTAAYQDATIKYGASITITGIDTSEFDKVKLMVQISDEMISERELKNLLTLNDCNYNITDFTLEKVVYDKSNIILVCDNSGSMAGSIGTLQNAVRKFLQNANKKENIGFYTFDNSIIQSLPLGSASDEELEQAVSNMDALGGTNIFGTLSSVLASAPKDGDAAQVIILMTDGQDGSSPSMDDIRQQIEEVAVNKGYTIHILGMGDINYDYLNMLAQAGGGRCIYSATDAELDSLYDFIHNTVKNQYRITFTAQDTMTTQNRRVRLSMNEGQAQASKTYSLEGGDAAETTKPFDQGVSIGGLTERVVARQKNNIEVYVTGTGFKDTDRMYLHFEGPKAFDAQAEYVNENRFRVILPEYMAEGEYDMEVHLSGRKALFPKELTVVDGDPDEIVFGGYRFKAYKVSKLDSGYQLSTHVIMNDWLRFYGPITLEGALDDYTMVLVDNEGSYVDFNKGAGAQGYAARLAEKGIPVNVPAMERLTIYNATGYGEDYPTEEHTVGVLDLLDIMLVDHPKIQLYPDRLTLHLESGKAQLPLQNFFLDLANETYSPFSIDFDIKATLTGSNLDLSGEIPLRYADADNVGQLLVADFLDMRCSVEKDVFSIKFDTMDDYFELGFNVKIPVLEGWVGASFWLRNGGLDGFQVRLDKDATIQVYAVPITFSDFSFSMKEFTKQGVTVAPSDVYLGVMEGGFSCSAYKVSALVPPLADLVGDLSLASVECTASTQLGEKFIYNLMGKSTFKLLDLINVMEVETKLGRFPHTEALLGMNEEYLTGYYFSMEKTLEVNIHNFYMNLGQMKKELMITSRFLGLLFKGGVDMKLDWWGWDPEYHVDGNVAVGVYKNNDAPLEFTVRASWVDGSKRKGILLSIDKDGFHKDLHHNYAS